MNSSSLLTSGVPVFRRSDNEVIEFKDAKGAEVFDTHGRKYIDFVLGYGPVVLGHSDPEFTEALRSAAAGPLMLPGFTDVHERLAGSIAEFTRANALGHVKVAYFKSSTESVAAACRIAAAKTGRFGIVRCGFLGWLDLALANTPRWHEPLESPVRGVLQHHEGFRGVTGDEAVVNWIDGSLESFERILAVSNGCLAAFVIDAYQLALIPPTVMISAIELARSKGLQIIYDETKTAGRTGILGSFNSDHPIPDARILGKAIANGLPLSLLACSDIDTELYGRCRLGGTYGKERLSVQAALVVAELMRARGGHALLAQAGHAVCDAINAAIASENMSSSLRAQPLLGGALWDLRFGEGVVDQLRYRQRLAQLCADEGLLLLQGHPSYVSLAHCNLDLAELASRFQSALRLWSTEKLPS